MENLTLVVKNRIIHVLISKLGGSFTSVSRKGDLITWIRALNIRNIRNIYNFWVAVAVDFLSSL